VRLPRSSLWMKHFPGGNVGHQPRPPVGLDVVLHRSRQEAAIEIPDQEVVLMQKCFCYSQSTCHAVPHFGLVVF
jgi:hypothetical protein